MTKNRTWTQRQRSVEGCPQVLRNLDGRMLQRRAERLAIDPVIEFPESYRMTNRTYYLLDQAGASFVNGQYTGCILALAAGVEHGLREILGA